MTDKASLEIALVLRKHAKNPFNDGTHTMALESICYATALSRPEATIALEGMVERGIAEEPSPCRFRIASGGSATDRSPGSRQLDLSRAVRERDPVPAVQHVTADPWYQGFACALAEICRMYSDYRTARTVMVASGITLVHLELGGVDELDLIAIRRAFDEGGAKP